MLFGKISHENKLKYFLTTNNQMLMEKYEVKSIIYNSVTYSITVIIHLNSLKVIKHFIGSPKWISHTQKNYKIILILKV